jgi:hypothetical protein
MSGIGMASISLSGGNMPLPIKRSAVPVTARSSISIKFLFLNLFLLLFIGVNGQLSFKERVEIPIPKGGSEFEVLPCSASGLMLHRTSDGPSPLLELIHLDTTFKQVWSGVINMDPKYQLANQVVAKNEVYFLFTNKTYADIHFQMIEVDLASGNFRRYTIRNYIPFQVTEFDVTKTGALVGGYFGGRIPVVLFFEFATHKSKILPGLFNEQGELVQMKREASGEFSILINAKNATRQRTLWIKRYSASGDLLQNEILQPEENSSLLFGRVLTLRNDQLIAGVYGQRNSDYSRGIFLARLNEDETSDPVYFPFADLENFFKFMKAKRELRVKERIQRKKIKGKKIRFQYRFLVHEFVEYGNEYILLGEAFYPKYRSVDRGIYGIGSTQAPMIFDGYQYTHAVILGFDKQGKLLWDNSFEINDVKTFTLEQFVKMDLQDDKIVLLYLFDNKIRTKIIQDNKVLEGKSFSTLDTTTENTSVHEEQKVARLEYWYGGHFLVSGVRNATRPGIGRQARQIFFVNKIRFE